MDSAYSSRTPDSGLISVAGGQSGPVLNGSGSIRCEPKPPSCSWNTHAAIRSCNQHHFRRLSSLR